MPISTSTPPHFLVFPLMSKGHTIPLLHLSHLLSNRHIHVTIITTLANHSTVKSSVQNHPISVTNLSFPNNAVILPPVIQITGKPSCMSPFVDFVNATQQLQLQFEHVIQTSHPPVTCIISDGFLFWTQDSADKLRIPRLVFNGMNIFSMTIGNIVLTLKPHAAVASGDVAFPVPDFPRIKFTANDLEPPFNELDPKGPMVELFAAMGNATARSHAIVVNSFYELEPEFNDYWNRNFGPKAWLVGPFCVTELESQREIVERPTWLQWLDMKLAINERVLYVAFGSHAEVSMEQLVEVRIGLERSNVNFMWVVKPKQLRLMGEGFEERVKGRGKVVTEWVDQMEILKHESVYGFLSHCGWNSVLESICAAVAILAMPLMAEQHSNARMVVEEIGVGLRLWPKNMVTRGLVEAEEVAKMAMELMEGEGGKRVTKKVKEVKEDAYGSMKEGGSSSRSLDLLIDHVCGFKMFD